MARPLGIDWRGMSFLGAAAAVSLSAFAAAQEFGDVSFLQPLALAPAIAIGDRYSLVDVAVVVSAAEEGEDLEPTREWVPPPAVLTCEDLEALLGRWPSDDARPTSVNAGFNCRSTAVAADYRATLTAWLNGEVGREDCDVGAAEVLRFAEEWRDFADRAGVSTAGPEGLVQVVEGAPCRD